MSKSSGKQGCESVRELLSAHIDGQLAPSERGPVEEHLASCKPCREEFVSLRATKDMLQCLPFARPARSFTLSERPAPRPLAFGILRLATAVAAFLLLLVGIGDWWHVYPTVAPSLPPAPVATTVPTLAPAVVAETPQPAPTQTPTRKSVPGSVPGVVEPTVPAEPPAPPGPGGSEGAVSPAGPIGEPGTDGQPITAPALGPAAAASTMPSVPKSDSAAAPLPAPGGEYAWPVRPVEIGLLLVLVVLLVLTLVARRKAQVEVKD